MIVLHYDGFDNDILVRKEIHEVNTHYSLDQRQGEVDKGRRGRKPKRRGCDKKLQTIFHRNSDLSPPIF